ncbi:MAG: allantoicase [Woeseiaceae bacterium]
MKSENPFHQWIRLEQPRLGTRVVYATDEFFAAKERLIDVAEPVWIDDKYDDHGKWMDGWESRRKRTAGHDYCVVRLGIPGVIHGFDIDTRYFTGNFPPAASIEVCQCDDDIPGEDALWRSILPRQDLVGDAHNYFAIDDGETVTHLRLNIFPDGGVARLRIFGQVRPDPGRMSAPGLVDLIGMKNGGRAVCCSDEHYGSMHNLNLPGDGTHMGDGWETARRRGPGNDWVVFELGRPGIIEEIEIDTAYFKGNYPDRAEVRGAMATAGDDLVSSSERWAVVLPEKKLDMDKVHTFKIEDQDAGPVSHVRLNVFPDGGVSRMRIRGKAV